ncbi:MAG: hypothetical protein K9L30_09045 [Desulfobacterales bacterium]|nr:hypothetical protein [Desulfobacterales bacterium]
MRNRMSRKTKTRIGFGVYFFTVLFPIYCLPIFNKLNVAEPFIGPFPFIVFVIFLIGVLVSLGLIVLFEVEDRRGDLL